MTSQARPMNQGQSTQQSATPSWRDTVDQRLTAAVEKFNQDNKGKTWVQIADAQEAALKAKGI